MEPLSDQEILNISEAAAYAHITKTAVYVAIYNKKIKAKKIGRYWAIAKKDLDEYRANKYNIANKKFNGEKIYDIDKGCFTIGQAAVILANMLHTDFDKQRLYYRIRTGELKATQVGNNWVVTKEQIEEIYRLEICDSSNKLEVS